MLSDMLKGGMKPEGNERNKNNIGEVVVCMKFAVFLDIDGVLNTRTTCECTPDGHTGIDDARIDILAKSDKEI